MLLLLIRHVTILVRPWNMLKRFFIVTQIVRKLTRVLLLRLVLRHVVFRLKIILYIRVILLLVRPSLVLLLVFLSLKLQKLLFRLKIIVGVLILVLRGTTLMDSRIVSLRHVLLSRKMVSLILR